MDYDLLNSGIVLTIGGVLLSFRRVIEGQAKLSNTLRGAETKVTDSTIRFTRVLAFAVIAVGVSFLVLSFLRRTV